MKTTRPSANRATTGIAVVWIIIGCLLWGVHNAHGQTAPPANLSPGLQEVVKLTQAQMGDDVILAYIKNSDASYTLTADDILYLKGQGVSQNVISVLLQTKSATFPASVSPPPPPPETNGGATGTSAPAPAPSGAPSEPGGGESTAISTPASQIPAAPLAPLPQATPSIVSGQAPNGTTLSLPPGYQLYVYCVGAGGYRPTGPLVSGRSVHVQNVCCNNTAAEIAATTDNSNSYETSTTYHAIVGFGVSGFDYAQGFYAANPGPRAHSVSVQLTLTAPATVVLVGAASSQQYLTFSGLPDLVTDVPYNTVEATGIAHTRLGPGTYTVQESSLDTAPTQDPNAMVDLLGVFVFSDSPSAAICSNPQIPLPASSPLPTKPVVDADYVQQQLSPYGAWVVVPGYGQCWQPAGLPPGWRPYYDSGHWVYTDAGLYWQSDYPWGAIPFHYGRWAYVGGYGWMWAPAYEYAPAWVFWRHADADGYVGWAPLPYGAVFVDGGWMFGGRRFAVDYDFGFGASFFVFVGYNHLWEPDYHRFALRGDDLHRVFRVSAINRIRRDERGRFAYEGLDRDHLEHLTGRKVDVVRHEDLQSRERAALQNDRAKVVERAHSQQPVLHPVQPRQGEPKQEKPADEKKNPSESKGSTTQHFVQLRGSAGS